MSYYAAQISAILSATCLIHLFGSIFQQGSSLFSL